MNPFFLRIFASIEGRSGLKNWAFVVNFSILCCNKFLAILVEMRRAFCIHDNSPKRLKGHASGETSLLHLDSSVMTLNSNPLRRAAARFAPTPWASLLKDPNFSLLLTTFIAELAILLGAVDKIAEVCHEKGRSHSVMGVAKRSSKSPFRCSTSSS